MSRSRSDILLRSGLGTLAGLSGSVVLLILFFLVAGAMPALRDGVLPRLFLDEFWQPGSQRDPQYALLPMLAGSILVTVLAILIAAPLGIAGAIFHRFYLPPRFAAWNEHALELLAGVPSVVFGFWGLTVLVPLINRLHPPGQSLLAAGIVLGLMILQTVALTSQAALRAVPGSQLFAAAGLGLGRVATVFHIALPAARPGIVAGVILAVARAVGETMAVVMVCGNIAKYPQSVFYSVRPVTATIALEMGYATSSHKALLFTAALVLVLLSGALVGWLAFRKGKNEADVN